jgi:hypothetical protein
VECARPGEVRSDRTFLSGGHILGVRDWHQAHGGHAVSIWDENEVGDLRLSKTTCSPSCNSS